MTEVKNEVVEDELVVEEVEAAGEDNVIEEAIEVENNADSVIEELTVKLQEEENKRLRLLADYDNFKRRASLDQEALQKYRAQNVVTNLLPVLDNFARALSVEAKTEEAQSIMTGMEMIYRTLVTALETEGLVEIETLDQEFDPNFHQAIMTGADDTKPSGVILEEMQKGYLLKDRVLRPSMVKVNE
ncbi:nucleotide exchange factor GrpE [Sporosarcina sp. FSL K6-3457]|uniref:nucleotide exchange factor GrpE n=1 Tax=Sporosarcina sp. FSL K6-3457 TaxID=2978204 RepID=UPI0030F4F7E0